MRFLSALITSGMLESMMISKCNALYLTCNRKRSSNSVRRSLREKHVGSRRNVFYKIIWWSRISLIRNWMRVELYFIGFIIVSLTYFGMVAAASSERLLMQFNAVPNSCDTDWKESMNSFFTRSTSAFDRFYSSIDRNQ